MVRADTYLTSARRAMTVPNAGRPGRLLRRTLQATAAFAAVLTAFPALATARQVYGPQLIDQQQVEEQRQRDIAADNVGVSPREERREVRRTGRPFNYQLAVSPQLTYSDNVTLAPDGEELEDGLASVRFEGGLLLDRVNFSGIVNGSVELGAYFDPPEVAGEELYDQFVVDQNVTAAGTARLIENLLYLDVAANATQQALSERSQFSTQSIAANDQLADAFSYSVSPYVFSRLINDGTLEARYRYTNVTIDDGDAVEGIDDFLNDSETHEVVAAYDTGRLFDRVGFTFRAYGNQTEETGSDRLPEVDYEQLAFSWATRYALNRRVSVTATIGHDEIDTNDNPNFDDDDLSGVFWKAGLITRPGRRTTAQLEVGERYGGALIEGSARYDYSSRLGFRAGLQRNFRTGAQLTTAASEILQSETLSYAEELRRAQELTAEDLTNRTLQLNTDLQDFSARQSGLATVNSGFFSVIGRTGRNNFVVRASFDDADFGFQDVTTLSLGASFDRQMSRKLSLYGRTDLRLAQSEITAVSVMDCVAALATDPLTAGLTQAEIDALCANPEDLDDDTQTASVLAGLRYRLYNNAAAFVQYARTQRFADTDAQEYEENAVTVGVTLDF